MGATLTTTSACHPGAPIPPQPDPSPAPAEPRATPPSDRAALVDHHCGSLCGPHRAASAPSSACCHPACRQPHAGTARRARTLSHTAGYRTHAAPARQAEAAPSASAPTHTDAAAHNPGATSVNEKPAVTVFPDSAGEKITIPDTRSLHNVGVETPALAGMHPQDRPTTRSPDRFARAHAKQPHRHHRVAPHPHLVPAAQRLTAEPSTPPPPRAPPSAADAPPPAPSAYGRAAFSRAGRLQHRAHIADLHPRQFGDCSEGFTAALHPSSRRSSGLPMLVTAPLPLRANLNDPVLFH